MKKILNKKFGKVILGMTVIIVTTSAYAGCTTSRQCAGGTCANITICTTIPALRPMT